MLMGAVLLGTSMVLTAYGAMVGSALTGTFAEGDLSNHAAGADRQNWLPQLQRGRSYLVRQGTTSPNGSRRGGDELPDAHPETALDDPYLIEQPASLPRD